ncbi:Uncharacterised protein [Serratia proteamaculans]|uniref:replication protein RepO n=1 Tax=Serratia proteamaculans TaxID=28151 RepID=UPI00217C70E7|nr:replication protein RepO [Serratia proteamaculans]CAI0823514.1 Uncharacterised protein [Serratia proteamaculans]CAI1610862.1 Uncharacterised protein [Serratia proteamaculans]
MNTSKLLINEPPLLVMPSLAAKIGLNEAILLQQIHYWLSRSEHRHGGRTWFYRTAAEWAEELIFWSDSTIKRTLANLEAAGLISSAKLHRELLNDPYTRTKWYAINYDQLEALSCVNASGQNDQMLQENTTETTTENPPNPQEGDDADASGKLPKIKYQDVADAYNEILGERLPKVQELNDKRKRQIKRLLGELHEPTLDAVKAYFETFGDAAGPFYFGDNNRSWRAGFDYLLRSDVLVKTREGAL